METSDGVVTVSIVVPLTDPDVAVIVLVPAASVDASPAPLIVAVVGFEELHVAVAVRSCVLLSVYVPVAVNCCVDPLLTDGFAGVTAIETKLGAVTVSVVEPLNDPELAVIVLVPCASVFANPALLIVAMVLADDVHVAVEVSCCVLPSL
jgi:hypothetical protein